MDYGLNHSATCGFFSNSHYVPAILFEEHFLSRAQNAEKHRKSKVGFLPGCAGSRQLQTSWNHLHHPTLVDSQSKSMRAMFIRTFDIFIFSVFQITISCRCSFTKSQMRTSKQQNGAKIGLVKDAIRIAPLSELHIT